ncbi:MAG: formylglycine-generating enzyme family protein [Planctomycetota bacterium]
MGSNDGENDEKPIHEVALNSFLISKYEVTQGQWQKIMNNNPSNFKGDNNPVEQVSWDDCQEFCKRSETESASGGKTGLRLPTEAEWEYAARAGTTTKYYWGDSINDDYLWDNSNLGTHPVGQKKPNGFGLYDMLGNVWEWCQDWYGAIYYQTSSKK